jgi:translation initiation factor 2B subunit (eIF-2B alpha/beta/delta family)
MSYLQFRKKLELLKTDNIHGASILCRTILELFSDASNSLRKSEYRKLVNLLSSWRPPMGNLLNIIAEIEDSEDDPGANIMADICIILVDLEQANLRTIEKAAAEIMKYDSVVTISNSGTVAESIRLAGKRGWKGTLLVGESRPAMEGREFVASLYKSHRGYKIIYGTDNEILSRVPNAGAVFVGADLISDSFFVNKTGTAAMASLISEFRKMFVIADLSKYFPIAIEDLIIESHPAREIWPKHPSRIEIINRYFEPVKFQSNISFINDEGIWDCKAVKKYLDNSNDLR